MDDALNLLRDRGAAALWDRALGFLDHTVDQAMATQHGLLKEQLQFMQRSPLHQQLLGGRQPETTDDFREIAPLTSYDAYDATLGEQRTDVLAEPPQAWIRTTGRTRSRHKWIPLSRGTVDQTNWILLGAYLASAATERGDVRIPPHTRVFNLTAPQPYGSGTVVQALHEDLWPCQLFPAPGTENMPFEQRMGMAFGQAVTNGLDMVVSQASVMAGLGEAFGQRKPPGSIIDRLKNPRAFGRMGRAALRAKLGGHSIYPRDAWTLKGIVVGGMDSSLFRERIREYWGRYPLEIFVSSEALITGLQAWDTTTLTFTPHLNFLEFIAEDDLVREEANPSYTPRTVLMDELVPGRNYEMVITNLHGGPMTRYRTGDIVRITAAENTRAGIRLPQWVHYGRRSDLLDIGGFVRLTEQTVWRAVEESGVPYSDWVARKEVEGDVPVIHLRIEPRPENTIPADAARGLIHEALKRIEPDSSPHELDGWAPQHEQVAQRVATVEHLVDRHDALLREPFDRLAHAIPEVTGEPGHRQRLAIRQPREAFEEGRRRRLDARA
jgi:hypothetical protein